MIYQLELKVIFHLRRYKKTTTRTALCQQKRVLNYHLNVLRRSVKGMSFLASYRTRGFGSVYKARYIHSGEIVAVKKIKVEENSSYLLKEINILKECHCDFIIRYYESLVKDNHLWVLTYMGLYYM